MKSPDETRFAPADMKTGDQRTLEEARNQLAGMAQEVEALGDRLRLPQDTALAMGLAAGKLAGAMALLRRDAVDAGRTPRVAL